MSRSPARSRQAKKKRKPGRAAPAVESAPGTPDGRTLPDASRRRSVEDPLHDWPEEEAQADPLGRKRSGGDVERGDD